MGALQDFLNANTIDNLTAEVPVSERFKDENGNIMKFKIKALTDNEYENARKASTKIGRKGKVDFDSKLFYRTVVINNTIEPNFKDAESIKKVGCITPEQYVSKVLLAGELITLGQEISKLSGFDSDMDELVEEVKN